MPIESTHLADDDLMRAMDGELALERRTEVAVHVAQCVRCQERLAQFEAVSAALCARRESADAAHREGRDRLRQSLQREAEVERRRPRTWLRPRWAVAAALVLACGAAARMITHPTEPDPQVGARPVARLTPGATWRVTREDVCGGRTPRVRDIAERVRREVVTSYGMAQVHASTYELDYLVTPELGGAPDPRNLWPQRYDSPIWNARVKDQLERLLPELVCSGRIDLAAAQRDLAEDWIAAYKRHFGTDIPLPDPRGEVGDDDAPSPRSPLRLLGQGKRDQTRVGAAAGRHEYELTARTGTIGHGRAARAAW